MKKLFFVFIFILSAAILSGCGNGNGARVVMFTENPPPLTTMTMTTVSREDTFSEYMATYSVSESTESGDPNTVSRISGVSRDTVYRPDGVEHITHDTAAVFTYVVTDEVTSFADSTETTAVTEPPVSESESTATSVAETTAETETTDGETENSTVVTVSVPNITRDTALREHNKGDTVFSPDITKDTAFSKDTAYSNTKNGGT